MTSVVEPISEVDLAGTPDFRIGLMEVSPSACRIRQSGQEQRIEPRVMQVLVVLAARVGQTVTRDQLVDACWGGRIVSDDAVNRVLAQVRALSRSMDPPAFALETVPKVGVRLNVTASGPRPPGGQRFRLAGPGKWSWAIGAAAIAFVAAGFLIWRILNEAGPDAAQNGRVEVIRLEARDPDPNLRKFAADLSDSLVRTLSRSAIDTVPEVADRGDGSSATGAEFRVTGSVDRDGQDVVASIQVVDRRSGQVLSSFRETRPASSLTGFIDAVALDTAAPLSCLLEDRRSTRRIMSLQVTALYLNTCDAITREGNMTRMVETGRRLVAAAPDLAIGHALFAIAQSHLADEGDQSPEDAEALRRGARSSASRALALDPNTPKAYLAIANSYPDGTHFEEREQALLRARQIDPGLNPGRISYAELLHEVGRLAAAIQIGEQIMDSPDPRTGGGTPTPSLILAYAALGQMQQVDELLVRLQQIEPATARGLRWTMVSLWGDADSGSRQLQAIGPSGISPKAYACVQVYLRTLSQRIASHARGLPPECDGSPPGRRMVLLAREGDIDGAYGEAARLTDSPEGFLGFLYSAPMRGFRADARFMPLARRLGLTAYWTRTGHWPDFCAEPGLPYDCRKAAKA